MVQLADESWAMVEFCKKLNKLIILDSSFEEKAIKTVVTILTCNARIPEDISFILEDEFNISDRQHKDEAEDATGTKMQLVKRRLRRREIRMAREEMI